MDKDATWYGSRPRPKPHCIRRGPSSPRKGHSSPLFSDHVCCGHGRPSQLLLSSCMLSDRCLSCLSVCNILDCGQTVGWIKMKLGMQPGLGPGHIGPSSPSPNFRPIYILANMPLGMEAGLGPGHIVRDGVPAHPLPKMGHSHQFSAHKYQMAK